MEFIVLFGIKENIFRKIQETILWSNVIDVQGGMKYVYGCLLSWNYTLVNLATVDIY